VQTTGSVTRQQVVSCSRFELKISILQSQLYAVRCNAAVIKPAIMYRVSRL